MSKNTKVTVTQGCLEFLVQEVKTMRAQEQLLQAKVSVMDNFFSLVSRLEAKPTQGFSPDNFWQAQREIEKATEEAHAPQVAKGQD